MNTGTRTLIFFTVVLSALPVTSGAEPEIPFPGLPEREVDEKVAELLAYRIKKHNDSEGYEVHKKLVTMGSRAVPTLIHLSKAAANCDPRILHPEKHDDFGWALRRPIQVLVDIGDRRAIPLLSALVKYDHSKARRMLTNLAKLLCHGSDKQIEVDAASKDPTVSKAARMVLQHPQTFDYYKKKYRRPDKADARDD